MADQRIHDGRRTSAAPANDQQLSVGIEVLVPALDGRHRHQLRSGDAHRVVLDALANVEEAGSVTVTLVCVGHGYGGDLGNNGLHRGDDSGDLSRPVACLASVAMTRRHAYSGSPYEARYGFSRAVRIGDRVIVAGTAPIPPAGEPLEATANGQMHRCCEIAVAALRDLGAEVTDVVRTRMYLTFAEDADEVGRVHGEVFGAATPAATMVLVAGLLDPAWRIELEVEAVTSR